MTDNGQEKDKKLTAYERWELPNLEVESAQSTSERENALYLKEDTSSVTEEVEEDSLVYEPLTASQLEEIRSAAYDEGFIQGESEGYAKGHSEGLEAGKQEGLEIGKAEGIEQGVEQGKNEIVEQGVVKLERVETLLNQVYQEFLSPLEGSRAELESLLYQSVQSLVEKVCERELSKNGSEILVKGLNHALDSIGEFEGKVKLTVNSADVEALSEVGVLDRLDIQIDTDDSMLEGGFVLNSSSFFVDGRIEKKLGSVFDQLNVSSD